MTLVADALAWLEEAAATGAVHTVRVSFSDRLGAWRGKRVPAAAFLAGVGRPMGFCDGMIVCDVVCVVIDETPFSNFDTGYPDMHVHPDLARLHPVAWAPGEVWVFGTPMGSDHRPLDVAPVNVLTRVSERLLAEGAVASVTASLDGRLMLAPDTAVAGHDRDRILAGAADVLIDSSIDVVAYEPGDEPGAFRIRLAATDPHTAAEAVVVCKGALKELAHREGARAVFMTRTPESDEAARLRLDVAVEGLAGPVEGDRLGRLLGDARALLQPSVNAFKAGAPAARVVRASEAGFSVEGMAASAEADPFTAVAVALAAIGNAAGGMETTTARGAGGDDATSAGTAAGATGAGVSAVAVAQALSPPSAPTGLGEATALLRDRPWLADWLGAPFLDNSIPLLEREAALFAAAVTDWETDRYWGAA